jgi:hypothetical protein
MKNYMSVGERSYFKGVRYTCVDFSEYAFNFFGCDFCDVPRTLCPFVRCYEYERADGKGVVFVRSVREFEKKIMEGGKR